MRLLGRPCKASVALIPTVLALALFFTTTIADDSKLPNLSTATNQPAQTTTDSPTTTTATDTKTDASHTDSQTTTSVSKIVITNTGIGATGTRSAPVITGATSAANDRPTAGLPKLAGAFSYPPAAVPPTQNAPYMRVSNLPEGTVFICVGAVLGFVALLVLLWRGLIVWSLHRSVRRAAIMDGMEDTKTLFRAPAAPAFKYSDRESTLSLSNLGNPSRGTKKPRASVGHLPSAQSLFYSPTAGAAAGSLAHPGNRASSYLPAGYYAAGASAPGNGAGLAHIGSRSQENINLATLRPHSQGISRGSGMGRTPPDSPSLAGFPPMVGHRLNNSSSTIDLNPRTPLARAPSAYLEDLFDEAGGASGAGPSHSPLSHGHSPHGAPF